MRIFTHKSENQKIIIDKNSNNFTAILIKDGFTKLYECRTLKNACKKVGVEYSYVICGQQENINVTEAQF